MVAEKETIVPNAFFHCSIGIVVGALPVVFVSSPFADVFTTVVIGVGAKAIVPNLRITPAGRQRRILFGTNRQLLVGGS